MVVNPDFVTLAVYVQSLLKVKLPDSGLPSTIPDHLQLPNNMAPGGCVPHPICCGGGDCSDAGGGDVVDESEGEGEDDGVTWLYAASIPPTATMTAAIPVRIPGKDVQNDFLLSSSPIANFTISYSYNIQYQNSVFYLLSDCEIAVDNYS